METLIHADIFFFVSTILFSIIGILVAIALVQSIRLLSRIKKLSDKIEANIEYVSDDVKDFIASIRESRFFSWIIRPRRKK